MCFHIMMKFQDDDSGFSQDTQLLTMHFLGGLIILHSDDNVSCGPEDQI